MDALEEQRFNAELFERNSLIYLHCCALFFQFDVTVPSLPFLRLKGLYCHFSFVDALTERRVCMIPNSDSLIKKLQDVKSPCVVEVVSSTVFEVRE